MRVSYWFYCNSHLMIMLEVLSCYDIMANREIYRCYDKETNPSPLVHSWWQLVCFVSLAFGASQTRHPAAIVTTDASADWLAVAVRHRSAYRRQVRPVPGHPSQSPSDWMTSESELSA